MKLQLWNWNREKPFHLTGRVPEFHTEDKDKWKAQYVLPQTFGGAHAWSSGQVQMQARLPEVSLQEHGENCLFMTKTLHVDQLVA